MEDVMKNIKRAIQILQVNGIKDQIAISNIICSLLDNKVIATERELDFKELSLAGAREALKEIYGKN